MQQIGENKSVSYYENKKYNRVDFLMEEVKIDYYGDNTGKR
jgi:hypothetical protein